MTSQLYSIVLIFSLSLFIHVTSNGQGTLVITSPAALAGDYDCAEASGWAASACNFSGTFAFADDNSGTTTDGCEPIVNNVSGFVAVIDRGQCQFDLKAMNAQNAGAIGVIICNNDAGNPDDVIPLGAAAGAMVNIPVKMLSFNACQAIRAYTGGEPIEFIANEATHGELNVKALED